MKSIAIIQTLMVIETLIFGVTIASAHPFHFSSAEIEYNSDTKRFEVSLRSNGQDLETALTRFAGSPVNLEKTLDIDQRIVKYLAGSFYLTRTVNSAIEAAVNSPAKVESRSKLTWIGKEVDGLWVWLYFELEPPAGTNSLWLTNRVLVEESDEQLNTCIVRDQHRRQSITFDVKHPRAPLPTNVR